MFWLNQDVIGRSNPGQLGSQCPTTQIWCWRFANAVNESEFFLSSFVAMLPWSFWLIHNLLKWNLVVFVKLSLCCLWPFSQPSGVLNYWLLIFSNYVCSHLPVPPDSSRLSRFPSSRSPSTSVLPTVYIPAVSSLHGPWRFWSHRRVLIGWSFQIRLSVIAEEKLTSPICSRV